MKTNEHAAVLALGFRPFFLGASALSVVAVGLWLGVYRFNVPLTFETLPPTLWHAHALIYGYAVAVIAGFLLTAVKNWTGIQTAQGLKLLALFSLWAIARIALFFGDAFVAMAAVADLAFIAVLSISLIKPIGQSKQWRQLAILSKLVLLGIGNLLFYAGSLGFLEQGGRWGVYTGLYLVVGLILTMGRRVIPGFIERGVGYPVALRNRRWIDLSSMALFVLFFVLDTFTSFSRIAGWIAVALFMLHGIRAAGWHTRGIWSKPLLWSLYLAYLFITLGFGLYALNALADVGAYYLGIHAFAVGGIGVITMGMMARVSLGHTGRDVHAPPISISWALTLVCLAAVVRVLIPLADTQHYSSVILFSAALWICGFMVFAWAYFPILARPRLDGLPG
jgi:uncharacterized protein involved in response to NO